MAKSVLGNLAAQTGLSGGSGFGVPPAAAPKAVGGTTFKSPSTKMATAITNFNNRWQSRLGALTSVKGINMNMHVKPIYDMDLQRVQKGQRAFTDSQVVDFVTGLIHGKPPVMPGADSGGGGWSDILGGIGKDVSSLAGGVLHPINLARNIWHSAVGLDAAIGRGLGDVAGLNAKKSGQNTGFTDLWNDVQSFIPGYTQTARNVDKVIGDITRSEVAKGHIGIGSLNPMISGGAAGQGMTDIPGVNVIPGTYVGGNILKGNTGELYKHPVFAALDVLPQVGEVGKAFAEAKFGEEAVKASKLAQTHELVKKGSTLNQIEQDPSAAAEEFIRASEIIPKGSTWEALARGNPLMAATRALKIPFTHDKTLTGPHSITTDLARKWGVSSDIRDVAARQAQNLREGATYTKYKNLKEGQLKIARQAGGQVRALKEEAKVKLADLHSKGATAQEIRLTDRSFRERIAKAEVTYSKATEDIRRIGSADMFEYIWHNHSESAHTIQEDLKNQGFTPTEIATHMRKNYVSLKDWSSHWKVNKEFKDWVTKDGSKDGFNDAVVPRYMVKAIDRLKGQGITKNALGRDYVGLTNVFKYAVLVGPRHTVHVLFSNAMFMALDSLGYFEPHVLEEAFHAAHDPHGWINGLPRGVGTYSSKIEEEVRNFKTEEIHGIAQGKTLGRVAKEIGESKAMTAAYSPLSLFNPRNYRRLEEFVTDMSRAMVYFRTVEKSLKRTGKMGLDTATSTSIAHDAGLQAATRVLMDVDHMAPIERTIMRQVFPFYPFTRQLLRYMVKYPAEHPFKAAVLAAIGRIEMQDAQSGLPYKFMNLFPIGGVDNNGNQTFVDLKNMNPFRSLNGYSPWTVAGFMSELNPIITAPFAASGLNILTATPELYPQLTVDPNTGDLVAKRDPVNVATQMIGAIVPEFNTVAAMTGLSSNLDSLRQSDPTAYRQLLLSNLNIPFLPSDKNIQQDKVKYAKNLFQVGQTDTAAAVKSGDLSSIQNYNLVPYGGQLYTPAQLKTALAGG